MPRRKPRQEPTRCKCAHVADTPEYRGPRGRRAGLTGKGGAAHGNPFAHTGGCIHSELSHTTKATKNRNVVPRLRL